MKIIDETFKRAGIEAFDPDELLEKIKDDKEVWKLYEKGYTQSLNQCEREATIQKCKQFKPKNIVELSAFISAIRPGFKSMLQTFLSRSKFNYGVPALDNMLKIEGMTGNSADSSFLIHDEQILKILLSGKVNGDTANATLKFIKKKKEKEVLKVQEEFRTGFGNYLQSEEGKTKEEADEIIDEIFRIIRDAGSYLFCAAHSYAVSLDSTYCAWLKVRYPFELYATILKLFTEKGKKEKVSKIINEMYQYKGIKLTPGVFGQDNRDWYIDKENNTISQDLSSVKFVGSNVADDLYKMKDMRFDTFTDILRYLQMNTSIKVNQIEALIRINYFKQFGKRKKLLKLYDEFFNGTEFHNKITKQLKSYEKRMDFLRNLEQQISDEDLPIEEIVNDEHFYVGLCLSTDKNEDRKLFYIEDVDDKYGVNVKLYSIQRGTRGAMKLKKAQYDKEKIKPGNLLFLQDWKRSQKNKWINGKRTPVKGEYDLWITSYAAA